MACPSPPLASSQVRRARLTVSPDGAEEADQHQHQDGHRNELRLTAGRDEQLWYYRSLVNAFRGYPSRIAGELERVVAEIEVAAFSRQR